jgi:hypothetical protein
MHITSKRRAKTTGAQVSDFLYSRARHTGASNEYARMRAGSGQEMQEFEPLKHTDEVNVRLIAARASRPWVHDSGPEFQGNFRYRLKVFTIEIPPLRERPEDIPLLSFIFVSKRSPRVESRGLASEESWYLRMCAQTRGSSSWARFVRGHRYSVPNRSGDRGLADPAFKKSADYDSHQRGCN